MIHILLYSFAKQRLIDSISGIELGTDGIKVNMMLQLTSRGSQSLGARGATQCHMVSACGRMQCLFTWDGWRVCREGASE